MSYIQLSDEQAEALAKYDLPAFGYLYISRYLSPYQRRKAHRIDDTEERIAYVITGLNRKKHLPPAYEYLLKGKQYNGFTGIVEPEEYAPYVIGI